MLLAICSCRNNQEINLPPVVMLIPGTAAAALASRRDSTPKGGSKKSERKVSKRTKNLGSKENFFSI
jgi:hypothetical protein